MAFTSYSNSYSLPHSKHIAPLETGTSQGNNSCLFPGKHETNGTLCSETAMISNVNAARIGVTVPHGD